MGQGPEVVREKRPNEGLQPDGSVRINQGEVGGFDCALLSNGWEFSFAHPKAVGEFLLSIAPYLELTEEHAEALGREQLVEGFARALTNPSCFSEDEDEKLFASFTEGAIRRVGGEGVDFVDREFLNQTFLALLPHAYLAELEFKDRRTLLFNALDSLGMLNFETVTALRRRVIEIGKEDNELDIGDVKYMLEDIDEIIIRKVHELSPLPTLEELPTARGAEVEISEELWPEEDQPASATN